MRISIKDLFDKYDLLRYVEETEKEWYYEEDNLHDTLQSALGSIETQIENMFDSGSIDIHDIMNTIESELEDTFKVSEEKEDLVLSEFANHEYIELED